MARVLAIERIALDDAQLVYNFTVRGLHTYFVLEVGVLVHNAPRCGPSSAAEERAQAVEEHIRERNYKYKLTEEQISDEVNKVRNSELPEGTLGAWIEQRHGSKTIDYNCIGAVLCEYRGKQGKEPITTPNTNNDKFVRPDIPKGTPVDDYIKYDETYKKLNKSYDELKEIRQGDGFQLQSVDPGDLENLRPGDIIAFEESENLGYVDHLGVYVGDGLIFSKMGAANTSYLLLPTDVVLKEYPSLTIRVWREPDLVN
ncbi:MAG: hypothetical protein GY797_19345 [Deltaproteobacteria bacterium]|nr:hypothetical protein [Deltaproteobacteria bacterium]